MLNKVTKAPHKIKIDLLFLMLYRFIAYKAFVNYVEQFEIFGIKRILKIEIFGILNDLKIEIFGKQCFNQKKWRLKIWQKEFLNVKYTAKC